MQLHSNNSAWTSCLSLNWHSSFSDGGETPMKFNINLRSIRRIIVFIVPWRSNKTIILTKQPPNHNRQTCRPEWSPSSIIHSGKITDKWLVDKAKLDKAYYHSFLKASHASYIWIFIQLSQVCQVLKKAFSWFEIQLHQNFIDIPNHSKVGLFIISILSAASNFDHKCKEANSSRRNTPKHMYAYRLQLKGRM